MSNRKLPFLPIYYVKRRTRDQKTRSIKSIQTISRQSRTNLFRMTWHVICKIAQLILIDPKRAQLISERHNWFQQITFTFSKQLKMCLENVTIRLFQLFQIYWFVIRNPVKIKAEPERIGSIKKLPDPGLNQM